MKVYLNKKLGALLISAVTSVYAADIEVTTPNVNGAESTTPSTIAVFGAGVESATTDAAPTHISIADAKIRDEVSELFKEFLTKIMNELDVDKQQEIIKTSLENIQELLSSSTDEVEKELLTMHLNAFRSISEVQSSSDWNKALQNCLNH